MSCPNSRCPIKGKGAGWICSCEPPNREDDAVREITDAVAKQHRK